VARKNAQVAANVRLEEKPHVAHESAFGETLRATGSFAQSNPFRFSSKYTDDESGLLYYGRRYMSPSQGRFFGRDPIEEMGGLHLYAFVGNNAVNRWDYLGMDPYGAPKDAGSTYVEMDGDYKLTWHAVGSGSEGDELRWSDTPDREEIVSLPKFEVREDKVDPLDPIIGASSVVSNSDGDPVATGGGLATNTMDAPKKTKDDDWKPNKKDCDGLRSTYGKEISAVPQETEFKHMIDAINAAAVQIAMGAGAQSFEYANVVIRNSNGFFMVGSQWTDGQVSTVSTSATRDYSNAYGGWRNVSAVMHSHPPIQPIGNEVFSFPDQATAGPRVAILLTPSFDVRIYTRAVDGRPNTVTEATNPGRHLPGAISANDLGRLQQCAQSKL
jgi:RHS repeat-associated protein